MPFFCFAALSRAQDSALALPHKADSQLDSLAIKVAVQIRQSKIEPTRMTVFVMDFSNSANKQVSTLGRALAERFSKSLASHADGFAVADRNIVSDYLRDNFIDVRDLQSKDVLLALARFLGASGIVAGDLKEDPDQKLLVTLRLEGLGAPWVAAEALPLTPQMHSLLSGPAADLVPAAPSIPNESGVLRAGSNGVGIPECVYCPPPLLSDAASAAKYSGSLTLSVLVTVDGTAESLFVLKGAPFQMNERAIEAVHKWKFKPAMKDGKPVSSRVPVEITLRSY